MTLKQGTWRHLPRFDIVALAVVVGVLVVLIAVGEVVVFVGLLIGLVVVVQLVTHRVCRQAVRQRGPDRPPAWPSQPLVWRALQSSRSTRNDGRTGDRPRTDRAYMAAQGRGRAFPSPRRSADTVCGEP